MPRLFEKYFLKALPVMILAIFCFLLLSNEARAVDLSTVSLAEGGIPDVLLTDDFLPDQCVQPNENPNQCSDACGTSQAEKDLMEKIAQEEKAAAEAAARKAAAAKAARPVAYSGVRFTNNPDDVSCKSMPNHPGESSYKDNHYDEDCCIDYDEWFQPGCVYLYSDVKVSLNGKKSAPAYKAD